MIYFAKEIQCAAYAGLVLVKQRNGEIAYSGTMSQWEAYSNYMNWLEVYGSYYWSPKKIKITHDIKETKFTSSTDSAS